MLAQQILEKLSACWEIGFRHKFSGRATPNPSLSWVRRYLASSSLGLHTCRWLTLTGTTRGGGTPSIWTRCLRVPPQSTRATRASARQEWALTEAGCDSQLARPLRDTIHSVSAHRLSANIETRGAST